MVNSGSHVFCIFPDFLSCSIDHWETSFEAFICNCGLVYLSFLVCQFLLHRFWGSIVSCIHIQGYYIFLRNWFLYDYVMTLSLVIFLDLNTTFSDINITTPGFFWLAFDDICFCIHLFSPMSLYLKWVSVYSVVWQSLSYFWWVYIVYI